MTDQNSPIPTKPLGDIIDDSLKESILDAVFQYNRVDTLLLHIAEALRHKADDAKETLLWEEELIELEDEADFRALHFAADSLSQAAKLTE
jgi:hypothetical protein